MRKLRRRREVREVRGVSGRRDHLFLIRRRSSSGSATRPLSRATELRRESVKFLQSREGRRARERKEGGKEGRARGILGVAEEGRCAESRGRVCEASV